MARLLGAFVAWVVLSRSGIAEPTIQVRGRLRIALEHVESAHHALTLEGRLLDEATSEPMPMGTVAARLRELDDVSGRGTTVYEYAVPVDVDGIFRFVVSPLQAKRYVLHLRGRAIGLHDPAAPLERELDLSRRPIELRLFAPAEAAAGSATISVGVEAVALDDATGAPRATEDDVPVDLEVDGRGVASLLVKAGHATAEVPLVAPAGQEVTLKARFAGDETRGRAEAVARVKLVEPTALTLGAETSRVTLGAEVRLRGALRFGARAVGGLPIVVRIAGAEADHESVTVTTRPDGSFDARLRAPVSGTRAGFEAVFQDSDARPRGLPAATSELVVVDLAPGFSLVDLDARPAGTALGVAGAILAILVLLRIGALFAHRRAEPRVVVALPHEPPRATLRTASDRRLFGRVLDDERGTPIAHARVELQHGADAHFVLTDDAGAFAFEPADGDIALRIEARGFAPQKRSGRIPHRGEWAALEVRLVPLRAEVLRRYGAALATIVPANEKLGLRTPRELALIALRHRPSLDPTALRALRGWVEAAVFGPAAVPDDALVHMDQLVEGLRAEK